MFKNLSIYRLATDWLASASLIEDALAKTVFMACGPTQKQSAGWVPPRGEEHGVLVESIGGEMLLKLLVETRVLPSSVVKERVDLLAEKIEELTGRKPGKKARKDLAELATLELLPQAFTKRSQVLVWISPAKRLLVIDSPSAARAEEVVSLLVKTLDGLTLHLIQTAESPAACMAAWLMDGVAPEGFTIDRELELKSEDEMKSTVRYGRHALDIEEVRQHLAGGKSPTRLALTYKDRVSFVLSDSLQVRKINFLDLAFEGRDKAEKDEAFDADAAIATGELGALIPALIEAMGGEHDFLAAGAMLANAAAPAPAAMPAPAPLAGSDEADPVYDNAVKIVIAHKRASISLVQRHLQIGYNRAARLLYRMEKEGLVSPMKSDGGRELLRKAVPA